MCCKGTAASPWAAPQTAGESAPAPGAPPSSLTWLSAGLFLTPFCSLLLCQAFLSFLWSVSLRHHLGWGVELCLAVGWLAAPFASASPRTSSASMCVWAALNGTVKLLGKVQKKRLSLICLNAVWQILHHRFPVGAFQETSLGRPVNSGFKG